MHLKNYEISDHLGNVRAVVSDLKLSTLNVSTGVPEDFEPELKVINNLYAFGSNQPNRSFFDADGSGRYSYMGYEKDDEVKGEGNHIGFMDYGYDPRTGKRWNVDPKTSSYPWRSPYTYAANSPIQKIDKDGEHDDYYMFVVDASTGKAVMTKVVVENTNFTHRVHFRIHIKDKDGNVTKHNVTREQYAKITNQFIRKGGKIKGVPSMRIESDDWKAFVFNLKFFERNSGTDVDNNPYYDEGVGEGSKDMGKFGPSNKDKPIKGSKDDLENSSPSSNNENSKGYNPDTDTIMNIYRTETVLNKDGTINSSSRKIVLGETDTIKKSEVKDYDPVKGGHTIIQK